MDLHSLARSNQLEEPGQLFPRHSSRLPVFVCVCGRGCGSFFSIFVDHQSGQRLLAASRVQKSCVGWKKKSVFQVSVQHHSWFKLSIGCTHWRLLLHFILSSTEHSDPCFFKIFLEKVSSFVRTSLNFVEMVEVKCADVSPVSSVGLNGFL